ERRVPKALRELAAIAARPAGGVNRLRWRLDESTETRLQEWARRWGIPGPDGWWLRQVRRHVESWREHPKHAGHWLGFRSADFEPDWPVLAPWNANLETESDFRARVDAYIASTKALPGIQPVPVTFTEIDFDALVFEHVACRSTLDVVTDLERCGVKKIDERT